MSGSIIQFGCECGEQAKARQFSYDARPPYNMPREWTTDRNGRGVCPACSQAKRDATGFTTGDTVAWESGDTTVAGRVVAVAIQRYGRIHILVRPDGGTWRDQQALQPEQLVKRQEARA